MKILMLGGTRFFGKRAVLELVRAGHEVTIGTRGITADDFGDAVKRIILDRSDRSSLEKALKGKSFDVIYDNICYAPDDVVNLLEVMGDGVGKYIVTSSLGVYGEGLALKEEDFNATTYPVTTGKRQDFTYSEGKRLVEAVAYQNYHVPTIAVRFPIVIGENDYTKRLSFYIEKVMKGEEFVALKHHEPMSFITENEAGAFLAKLADVDFVGPINACSDGSLTVRAILDLIESQVGKKAMLVEDHKDIGPYSTFGNATLDNSKAKKIGGYFKTVETAFQETIAWELNRKDKG